MTARVPRLFDWIPVSRVASDPFFIPLMQADRLVAGTPPVRSVGYEPQQTQPIRRQFIMTSLAVVLSGHGQLERPGDARPIHAPAALLGRAGRFYEYGPNGSWEIFYVTFFPEHAAWVDHFTQQPEPELWPLHDPAPFRHIAAQIAELRGQEHRPAVADKIDHLGHIVWAEAYLQAQRRPDQHLQTRLDAVRHALDAALDRPLDTEALAADHHFAPRTLRRHFQHAFGCSPQAYHTRRRLQHAAELLCRHQIPVHEVASRCGYDDPLYFTRQFRRQFGLAPTEFRRQHPHG